MGIERTLVKLRDETFRNWKQIKHHIWQYIQKCVKCQCMTYINTAVTSQKFVTSTNSNSNEKLTNGFDSEFTRNQGRIRAHTCNH